MLRIALEGVLFACFIAAVPMIVYIDAVVFENQVSEESITEYMHNGLLLVTCLVYGIGAAKYPALRGYLLVALTFFTCLFIREMDSTLDKVRHGLWLYPVIAVLIVGTIFVVRNRDTVVRPLLQHYASRSGAIIYVGIFLLVFFSRLFGTGALWEPVMGENYDPAFKTVIQEGIELMAYALTAYGACLAILTSFGASASDRAA